MDSFRKEKKQYWELEKRRARLVFAYHTGNLDFRNDKKGEAVRKFGNTNCLVPACAGRDELSHVVKCFGYKTKPKEETFLGIDGNESLAEYLDLLDAERYHKFRAPLLFRNQIGGKRKLISAKEVFKGVDKDLQGSKSVCNSTNPINTN